jgi:hypothetical protein
MPINIIAEPPTVHIATRPTTENTPVLDERLWQAWVQKNQIRDHVRFIRRVRLAIVGGVVLALVALVQKMAG